jgi:hypothetical protein
VTPGIIAPDWSVTTPSILAATVCADAAVAHSIRTHSAAPVALIFLTRRFDIVFLLANVASSINERRRGESVSRS